jgi:hypothetical protein
MRRFLRYLRIAFSATCLIACVLLIVLWVRSYWWCEGYYQLPRGILVGGSTARGAIVLHCIDVNINEDVDLTVGYNRISISDVGPSVVGEPVLWFHLIRRPGLSAIVVPMWAPTVMFAGLAIAPWLRYRFSLRTLLMAMTLIAVALGLIVF